jgi:hypothetical protein
VKSLPPDLPIYAIAVFSHFRDRHAPSSESEAAEIVGGGEVGPWEPTVAPVEFGAVHGFRVSELLESPDPAEGDEFRALDLTQTTYLLDVNGRLGTVALSPASVATAAVILALVESVIETWNPDG